MIANRLKALAAAASIAAVLASGAAPALAQSKWDSLYERIIRLEHEIRDMRLGGASVPTGPASLGDSSHRLNVMEEELRHIAVRLQAIEYRLDRLEGGAQISGDHQTVFDRQQAEAPQPQWPQVDSYDARDIAPQHGEGDLAQLPETSGGPKVLGTLAASQLETQSTTPPLSGGQSGSLVPDAVEQAALDGGAAEQGADGAEGVYRDAYENLLGRRFGAAEAGFKLFLDRHDGHVLAGDAQYWLGETYYVQGDYKQAAQSFLKGYRTHPKGRKAPDTLFKLGLSLQHLGQKPQACSTFAEVAKQYPTAANIRNEAIKEMTRAGC